MIVKSYVVQHKVRPEQLSDLIPSVHSALGQLGQRFLPEEVLVPAVSVRRSVHQDYVVCLDCGWRGKMLRRHLDTGHGFTVGPYPARWNLPLEHPMTAPSYSERRSGLAKQSALGRGRGRRASREEPESAAPETGPAPQPQSRPRGSARAVY